MNELLLYSLGIYLSTCSIWLIICYIYCHIHYDTFTIKEMIGFGNTWDADDNFFMFFPLYNTLILLLMGVIAFCCFIGYLLNRIGNIKLF